ncbi:recombinase family protein [Candidatus Parcubacteria bacterium]|nr:recombinase family protein [Candidatus Parcubacteria bacterium]
MAKTKLKRVAIYIRCSSDEAKKEGYSPRTQKEKLKEFVKNNGLNLDKKHIYDKDIGFSGSVDKRPGLQKLLIDARNREFDIVLVYRLDRFFRKLTLLLNTVSELKNLGIELKSITEGFDTATPSGRAMFQSAGVFAEWQREITLEARNEGMIKAMKEGKYLSGTLPFGYRVNKEIRKLEIDKKESVIVKKIYSWLVDSKLSEYKIQQKINSLKIPTKFDRIGRSHLKKTKSKNWWNRGTLGRILRNKLYAGEFYYRKYKNPNRTRINNNLRPKKDWIQVKVPAIISEETFNKAQEQLKKNKILSPRKTKLVYALQHKIVCGLDGRRYQCARRPADPHRKETKYYFCSGIRPAFTPNLCQAPTISESRILPPIWENLKNLLFNPKEVIEGLKFYREQKNKRVRIQKKLEAIKKILDVQKRAKERYAELYTEGSIEKSFYNRKLEKCNKEIENLISEKERFNQLLLSEEEMNSRIKSLQDIYQEWKESLENATYEMKVSLVQKLTNKIIIKGNQLDIEYLFPFKNLPAIKKLYTYSPRMDRTFQSK